MTLFLDYKKTFVTALLASLLSAFFLSYTDNPTSNTVLISNPTQENSDQIIQAGLALANGYTGQSSIIISKDSIYYKSNFPQLHYDTATPKELWSRINDISNINIISKIVNGESEQNRDGTDTIYYIRTKSKKCYSFTNGRGKEFDEQKEFLSLLMTQLSIYSEIALNQSGQNAYR